MSAIVVQTKKSNRPSLRLPNRFARIGILTSLEAIALYAKYASNLQWERDCDQKGSPLNMGMGGLPAFTRRCCRNGKKTFGDAHREIQEVGLLKGAKVSYAHNKFECFYDLKDKPDFDTPAMRDLTHKAFAEYKKNRLYAPIPDTDYLLVPAEILCDSTLSLKDVGLYIVILETWKLECVGADETMLKQRVFEKCRDARDSFGAMQYSWDTLKERGYLHQHQTFYANSGRFDWRYALTATPQEITMPDTPMKVSKKPAKDVPLQSTHVAKTRSEKSVVAATIAENVQADKLREQYSPDLVEDFLRAMQSVVCSKRHHLRIKQQQLDTQEARERMLQVDYEMAVSVLNRVDGRTNIQNRPAYIMTLLLSPASLPKATLRYRPLPSDEKTPLADLDEFEAAALSWRPIYRRCS